MFRLPFLFIVTGLICFGVFHALNLLGMAEWMLDSPRNPAGWFRVHLLVLGWGTMIAMGAMYQLISVVMQTELYSRKIGYIHYGLFTAGTVGLLWGFHAADMMWIAGSASIAFAGILLFSYNIIATLMRANQWNVIAYSAATATVYLALTGVLGLLMGLNLALQRWPHVHDSLLHAHIWLGSIGWFGMLIIGFSYKMLPMFYLAHQFPVKLQRWIFALWNIGAILGAISMFLTTKYIWTTLALGCLLLAVLAYNIHIRDIERAKHKKHPGRGVQAAVYSTRALILIAAVAVAGALYSRDEVSEQAVVIIGWAYIWGWISFTILGYLSKIIPFLWWTHKYGSQMDKKNIPMMTDLIPERPVVWGLAVIAGSTIVILSGLLLEHRLLIQTGGVSLSVSSVFYFGLLMRVFTK